MTETGIDYLLPPLCSSCRPTLRCEIVRWLPHLGPVNGFEWAQESRLSPCRLRSRQHHNRRLCLGHRRLYIGQPPRQFALSSLDSLTVAMPDVSGLLVFQMNPHRDRQIAYHLVCEREQAVEKPIESWLDHWVAEHSALYRILLEAEMQI